MFLFLGAAAAGTILGGPIGDAIGRKSVIWFSILGVVPFTLALPYMNLFWTDVFAIMTGLILASAFPAIVVYAQELLPGKVGMVAGLFFGFAFGMGGLGAAVLGLLADHTSIAFVYKVCSFLPLIGILTYSCQTSAHRAGARPLTGRSPKRKDSLQSKDCIRFWSSSRFWGLPRRPERAPTMRAMSTSTGWSRLNLTLHWLIVVLIIAPVPRPRRNGRPVARDVTRQRGVVGR